MKNTENNLQKSYLYWKLQMLMASQKESDLLLLSRTEMQDIEGISETLQELTDFLRWIGGSLLYGSLLFEPKLDWRQPWLQELYLKVL